MRTLQSRDSEIAPTEDRISIALAIRSLDPTRVGRTVSHDKRDRDGS